MREKYERASKGSNFAIAQHIHSAHCISRFYGEDKLVEVMLLHENKVEKRNKKSQIFVTKRKWSEKQERGFMARIEDAFHYLISNESSFEERNHQAISDYVLLWRLRHHFKSVPHEDVTLNGIIGSKSSLTKNEEEIPYYSIFSLLDLPVEADGMEWAEKELDNLQSTTTH